MPRLLLLLILALPACVPVDDLEPSPTPLPPTATPEPTTATPAPASPTPTPVPDADNDGHRADQDCDDHDASIYPGALETCDDVDRDCDGSPTDNAVDATPWFPDSDGDGYGRSDASGSSQGITACVAPDQYLADSTDCDDLDAEVHPGAEERCNAADDDCNGQIDEGLPDLDASGIADCDEVAVIPSAGFQSAAYDNWCETINNVERELREIATQLKAIGLSSVVVYENPSSGVDYDDISLYPAVIYDNGGSSGAPALTTLASLNQAAAAGKALLFIGDDLAEQAWRTEDDLDTRAFYDLVWLYGYYSSGLTGNGADVVDGSHPVIKGPHGTVQSFDYRDDLDWASLAGRGEQEIMRVDVPFTDYPAVLVADAAGQRTVTMLPCLYNSNAVCPISDADGLVELQTLFRNAMTWLLHR